MPNALIKDQFVGYFECQVLPDGIEITEDTLFEDRYDYDVLLVDEGDVIVRDWCLVFEQLKGGLYKPRGLYSMKAKPFIMFTATFSTGEKAIMMKALQCHKPEHWLKFEPGTQQSRTISAQMCWNSTRRLPRRLATRNCSNWQRVPAKSSLFWSSTKKKLRP